MRQCYQPDFLNLGNACSASSSKISDAFDFSATTSFARFRSVRSVNRPTRRSPVVPFPFDAMIRFVYFYDVPTIPQSIPNARRAVQFRRASLICRWICFCRAAAGGFLFSLAIYELGVDVFTSLVLVGSSKATSLCRSIVS